MIRVRRHTDGRVALQVPADRSAWSVVKGGGQRWVHQDYVVGDGWSELLVAELPEPDDDACGTVWNTDAGSLYVDGGEISRFRFEDPLNVDTLRSDALKMLAAVAACEKYRHERETTT
jgi:hypothetical protein